jgi:tRNA(His) guanylyltransferase
MSDLSKRIKSYEEPFTKKRFIPTLPIGVRLDGVGFSKLTKDLRKYKPFSADLASVMIEVTRDLVEKTNAKIGYTGSDEISLVIYSGNYDSGVFYDGREQKIISVLASYASMAFTKMVYEWRVSLINYGIKDVIFDCRAFQLPNVAEAANYVIERELDVTRNSVSIAAQHYYSHKELQNKNSNQMMDMLINKEVNWNDYPEHFKRGTYIGKVIVNTEFTPEEIEQLPPNHAARTDPNLTVDRRVIRTLDIPRENRFEKLLEVLNDSPRKT